MAQLLAGVWTAPQAFEDDRSVARRKLRLALPAATAQAATTNVLIRDLSELGFMIETTAKLAVGETFQVHLPEAGPVDACVVWNIDSAYGCRFLSRVSKGTVSAALLLSPVDQSAPADVLPRANSWLDHDDDIVENRTHRNQTTAMVSLALLSVTVILFMFALFSLPFSSEQFSP